MTRNAVLASAAGALVLSAASAAPAGEPANASRLTEIGSVSDTKPSCPEDPCLALTYTTGLQVQAAGKKEPMRSPRTGRIVAFTVRLGKPDSKQIAFYRKNFGRRATVRLTVLKPGKSLNFSVTGQSEDFVVDEYFGRSVQFPLKRSLTARKGYVVALTVPTWAPVLAAGLDKTNAWRASRARGACDPPYRQTAQTKRTQTTQYRCLYRTARLTYSATLVSTP